MINSVLISNIFKREAKLLIKKYHTLRTSIEELIEHLIENSY